MAAQQLNEMIIQPETPAKIGELLTETIEQQRNEEANYISIFSLQPTDPLFDLERNILQSEQYVLTAEWFVEFMRQAAVDEETTQKFDKWMGTEELIEFIEDFVHRILKNMLKYVCGRQKEAATDIRDLFATRDASSEPPDERLFVRIRELEMLAKQYVGRVKALMETFESVQGNELVAKLIVKLSDIRPLTADEKIHLLHSCILHAPIDNPPSMRREDWYDDDGR